MMTDLTYPYYDDSAAMRFRDILPFFVCNLRSRKPWKVPDEFSGELILRDSKMLPYVRKVSNIKWKSYCKFANTNSGVVNGPWNEASLPELLTKGHSNYSSVQRF